jgi:hypothetical protein
MLKTVIVGAGLAGLTVAKHLKARGLETQGLERETRPGGRLETGHHRLYTAEARDLLTDTFPGLEWLTIEEEPAQLRKGEWGPVSEELDPPERFYMGKPYFHPKASFSELVAKLAGEVGSQFALRSLVVRVDLDRRVLVCLSGNEVPFDRLIWTSSLASLGKAISQTPQGLSKKKTPVYETGGITWDMRVTEPLFTQTNTLVFPFRYKDLKVRALGTRAPFAPDHPETYHWMIFLEDALLENHEELAKIVRAFKRELTKQFPVVEKGILQERIAFHTSLSGEAPVPVTSLEVFPGVACVGPDIQTEEVSPGAERHPRRNLDVVLRNCLDFMDLVLPKWTEVSAPGEKRTAAEAVPAPLES